MCDYCNTSVTRAAKLLIDTERESLVGDKLYRIGVDAFVFDKNRLKFRASTTVGSYNKLINVVEETQINFCPMCGRKLDIEDYQEKYEKLQKDFEDYKQTTHEIVDELLCRLKVFKEGQ